MRGWGSKKKKFGDTAWRGCLRDGTQNASVPIVFFWGKYRGTSMFGSSGMSKFLPLGGIFELFLFKE